MSGEEQRKSTAGAGPSGDVLDLAAARERVVRGHEAVQGGRYGEALRAFREALPALVDALGEAADEVVELRLDCDTVVQMAQIASLGRSLDPQWDSPVGSLAGEVPPRR
jgi:hypothetical protein